MKSALKADILHHMGTHPGTSFPEMCETYAPPLAPVRLQRTREGGDKVVDVHTLIDERLQMRGQVCWVTFVCISPCLLAYPWTIQKASTRQG